MQFALSLTQAPHASYSNGGLTPLEVSDPQSRQYWLRPTQYAPVGPLLIPAVEAMAQGAFQQIMPLVVTERTLGVFSPQQNSGYSINDWNPRGHWDEPTQQIIMGGLRRHHKIIAYSDLTGAWREVDQPLDWSRFYGTGHWYGNTTGDGAGSAYLKAVKLDLRSGAWIDIADPVATSGSAGSHITYSSTANSGRGGLILYGGDIKRWQLYDPVMNAWTGLVDNVGNGQHAAVCYHPSHQATLIVGGTGTPYVASLVSDTGAVTRVADCPREPDMSVGGWSIPHPDGYWLIRTTAPTLPARLMAYWPLTNTWEDKGVSPDNGLQYPSAAYDSQRAAVYITASDGLYAYKLVVTSGRAATISNTEGGDVSAVGAWVPANLVQANAGDAAAVVGAAPAAPGDATAPTLSGDITITGSAVQGQALTAGAGTWANTPTSYAYRWFRGATPISGATASTYVLQAGDVGSQIRVGVIAGNAAGSSSEALSAQTAVVTAIATTAQVISGPFTNPATRQPLPLTLIEHVVILSIASPAIVLSQTHLTTDASARLTVANAALTAGTNYLLLAYDTTGSNVGVKRVTAT